MVIEGIARITNFSMKLRTGSVMRNSLIMSKRISNQSGIPILEWSPASIEKLFLILVPSPIERSVESYGVTCGRFSTRLTIVLS